MTIANNNGITPRLKEIIPTKEIYSKSPFTRMSAEMRVVLFGN